MKNLKQKKTKNIFVLAAASGVFILFAIGGYVVLERMLHAERVSLEDDYRSVLALGEKELLIQNLESSAESVRVDIEKLQKYTIDSETPVIFVQRIEGLADFSGADVEVTSLAIKDKGAQIQQLVLKFVGTGTWEEITHLLQLIERIPVRSDVKEIQFTFKSDSETWQLEGVLMTPLFERHI
jgi:hypothetical protein